MPAAAQPTAATAVAGLIETVRARELLGRRLACAARCCLIAALALLVLVATSRLCGWQPRLLGWPTLALPPLIAAAWALARCRALPRAAAARRCDGHLGGDDLLLSAVSLHGSDHGFAPVLAAQAAARARAADPRAIAPIRRWSPLGAPLGALAALAAAILLVPILDPFGTQARLRAVEAGRQAIAQARTQARARAAAVAAAHPEAAVSAAVAKDLARIQDDLAAMKPTAINPNKATLSKDRTELKARLEQMTAERFAHSLDSANGEQLGGEANHEAARQLADNLERGKSEEAATALDEAKAIASQLALATSVADRQRLAADLARKLATLQQAAGAHPSGFSAAVAQALDQLGRSSDPELRSQSLQALSDALDLAKLEAQSDAQGARDAQSLQQALQALHMADQLNAQGQLQGSAQDMEAYATLYAQMLDQFQYGQGNGQHPGGRGQGAGGSGHGYRTDTAKDDAHVDAAFHGEQLRAPLKPGQIVASWTEHGPADPGAVVKAYAGSLGEVKQEVPAALEREQVPEAYHAGVKKYFDGIENGR